MTHVPGDPPADCDAPSSPSTDHPPKTAKAAALIGAAFSGNVAAAQCLLRTGADINERNLSGDTPLLMACWRGRLDMVGIFLEAGADPDMRENGKKNPLVLAAWMGFTPIVAQLLNVQDVGGPWGIQWRCSPPLGIRR